MLSHLSTSTLPESLVWTWKCEQELNSLPESTVQISSSSLEARPTSVTWLTASDYEMSQLRELQWNSKLEASCSPLRGCFALKLSNFVKTLLSKQNKKPIKRKNTKFMKKWVLVKNCNWPKICVKKSCTVIPTLFLILFQAIWPNNKIVYNLQV